MGLGIRWWGASAALALAALAPASAAADVGCTPSGATTYTCSVGAADTWTVPAGWDAAQFTVHGAAGGGGDEGGFASYAGGDGGGLKAELAVAPGALYDIEVGAAGTTGSFMDGAGDGGDPGGGNGSETNDAQFSGGGGGYSSVALGIDFPVLIAGGGGGGGASQLLAALGGAGGGTNGGAGGSLCGAGGDQSGEAGSMTEFGGSAGTNAGGGGGGGYWGGEGGSGCGGGGGSGFLSPNALSGSAFQSASTSGDGTVTIAEVLRPSVTLTTPASGAVINVGQVVDSSFTCAEGNLGPGMATCLDQGAKVSGSPIDTSTPGAHSFTVTATSTDGLTASATHSYTVVGPPTVSIARPLPSSRAVLGAGITAAFTCTDATGGPGISSCVGAGGIHSGSALSTCTLGVRSLTVTATSEDGQTAAGSAAYSVVLPRTAQKTGGGRSFTLTPATVCVARRGKLSVSLASHAKRHAQRIVTVSYFIDRGVRARHHRTRPNRVAHRAGRQTFSVGKLTVGSHVVKVVIVLHGAGRTRRQQSSVTVRLSFSVAA